MQLSTNQDNLLFDALLKARNEDFHSQPLEEVRCLPLRAQDASLRTQRTSFPFQSFTGDTDLTSEIIMAPSSPSLTVQVHAESHFFPNLKCNTTAGIDVVRQPSNTAAFKTGDYDKEKRHFLFLMTVPKELRLRPSLCSKRSIVSGDEAVCGNIFKGQNTWLYGTVQNSHSGPQSLSSSRLFASPAATSRAF